MKVLLTGYSGTLGTVVAKSLLENGHQLRVLFHGAAIKPQELDPGVEIFWGSLSQTSIFNQLTSKIDVVVHCAWDGRGAFDAKFENVNLYGTTKLIEAANSNNVKAFIHISSVAVYGLNRSLWNKLVDEEYPFVTEERSMNSYPWVKVLIEKECERLKDNIRMNLVIIRPGLLFSDTKAPAKKVISLRGGKYGLLVGNAKNHLPYIHVNDVAEMILILLNTAPKYAVYNCVPTIHLSAKYFLKRWAERYDKSVRILRIPPCVLRMMNKAVRILKKALGQQVGMSSIDYQIFTGIRNIKYDAAKAVQQLNWQDVHTTSLSIQGSDKYDSIV